jgi:hypothetical protein
MRQLDAPTTPHLPDHKGMSANNSDRLWITTKEAARLIGLHPATLANWRSEEMRGLREPKLRWKRFGRAVRYYAPDVYGFERADPTGQAA